MTRTIARVLLCFTLLFSGFSVADEFLDELILIGGIDVGHKSQTLDQLLDTPLNFYTASVNTQVIYQHYFLGLSASQSISDARIAEDGEVGLASRSDYDLTLGWNTNANITLFGGYKTGTTNLNFETRELENSSLPQEQFAQSFKESGPYLGVAYTKRFSPTSQLTVSLAYAMLKAKNHLETADSDNSDNSDNDNDEDEGEPDELDFDDLSGDFTNDANGFSVAIKWSVQVVDNVYYTMIAKTNRYKQDIEGNLGGLNKTFHTDENFIALSVGLAYVF